MVSAARTWALFKSIRIFIFLLSTIMSIALTALYIFFLVRGWGSFMAKQCVIIIILISIYVSFTWAIIQEYVTRIVVLFRPRMDGAWIAFLVLLQVGGAVVFFLLRPSLPCHSIVTCKAIEDTVIFGAWSLSGLLLIYASSLVIMSYVPVPAPCPNPEAALAIKSGKETKEKRQSVGSRYSWSSFVVPATPGNREPPIISPARTSPNYYRTGTPTSVRSIVPSIHYPMDTRTPSITSPGRMGSNYYYRPGTPESIRSTTTSRSSTQGLTNPKYNYIYPSRVTTPASSTRSALSVNAGPPNESISRQETPLPVVSYLNPTATDGLHNQQHPRSLTPSSLTPGIRGQNASRSLTYVPNMAAPALVQPLSATVSLQRASPGFRRIQLEGSVYISSRSGSVSSVPRSPSPQNLSFDASIPVRPMATVLPAHPGLPMNSYYERGGGREVRRHGSVPDIRFNDAATYANAHHRTVSDYPRLSVNNFVLQGKNEQHANLQRWK